MGQPGVFNFKTQHRLHKCDSQRPLTRRQLYLEELAPVLLQKIVNLESLPVCQKSIF